MTKRQKCVNSVVPMLYNPHQRVLMFYRPRIIQECLQSRKETGKGQESRSVLSRPFLGEGVTSGLSIRRSFLPKMVKWSRVFSHEDNSYVGRSGGSLCLLKNTETQCITRPVVDTDSILPTQMVLSWRTRCLQKYFSCRFGRPEDRDVPSTPTYSWTVDSGVSKEDV